MPTKNKIITFTVQGTRPFPLDMLRYDCAWPKTQRDVNVIQGEHLPLRPRTVTLQSACGAGKPTVERWATYGWTVTEDAR